MNSIVKIHHVTQGSPEWLELRALGTWNASEAPIIMGDHPKMSRDEFIHAKATKTPKEFDSYTTDVIFEKGHATEDAARKVVSELIGEELYRVTITNQIDDYVLLSSLDGATMELAISMEHKQWSKDLVAYLETEGEPPSFIYWQLEHQLATVPDMEKVLWVVSDGTKEKMVVHEYRRVPGRWTRLLAGWRQYEADRKAYIPKMKEAKPVGIRPADLPVPILEVSGEIATQGNLHDFNIKFREMVASFNADLRTDHDFAQASEDVKYMNDLRNRLEQSKKMALNKAVPLSEAFAMIDALDELARVTAKNLEDQIKIRKNNRKTEIANDALSQVRAANDAAEAEFKPHGVIWQRVGHVAFDPYETMKGLKSFDSMASKVGAATTKAKLDINEKRDKVRANLKVLQDAWVGFEFLFRDITDLVNHEASILPIVIKQRISDHQDKLRETETARINSHRQTLIKLEAPQFIAGDGDIATLRACRTNIESINTAKLEEFAAEGEAKKQATLNHLNSMIAKLEAEELSRQREELARKQKQDELANLADAAQSEPEGTLQDADNHYVQQYEAAHQPARTAQNHAMDAAMLPVSPATGTPILQKPTESPTTSATPSSSAIITHLMVYYGEDRETIVEWIKSIARSI